jgi:hypothetical protein
MIEHISGKIRWVLKDLLIGKALKTEHNEIDLIAKEAVRMNIVVCF